MKQLRWLVPIFFSIIVLHGAIITYQLNRATLAKTAEVTGTVAETPQPAKES